jgi:hypothetical protein
VIRKLSEPAASIPASLLPASMILLRGMPPITIKLPVVAAGFTPSATKQSVAQYSSTRVLVAKTADCADAVVSATVAVVLASRNCKGRPLSSVGSNLLISFSFYVVIALSGVMVGYRILFLVRFKLIVKSCG